MAVPAGAAVPRAWGRSGCARGAPLPMVPYRGAMFLSQISESSRFPTAGRCPGGFLDHVAVAEAGQPPTGRPEATHAWPGRRFGCDTGRPLAWDARNSGVTP